MAIEQFDEAMLAFFQVYPELNRMLEKLPSFSRFHRRRALHSAYDILSFTPILRDAHIDATQLLLNEEEEQALLEREFPEFYGDNARLPENSVAVHPRGREFLERLLQGSGFLTPREYWLEHDSRRRLVIACKGMFFFIRAYQDVLCAVLQLLLGQNAGHWTSMNKALEKNNIVGKLVDNEIPAYREWFKGWKNKRDRIKVGIAVGLVGPAENVGVAFARFSDNDLQPADMTEIVRLADFVHAVEFSTLLVQTAISKVQTMAD